ncbi:MAG: hypothetical protein LBS92_06450 [Candidatus Methanoplasma sp.]|jgi:hypothetical protein|nr:hypothetical protein [Candidatus Methanoplasma sp.]
MTDFNIGEWIYGVFGGNELGVLLCIFLIFMLDAVMFPTLPEVFFAMGVMYRPDLAFGVELLLVAIIAEIAGTLALYLVVSRVRVPARIERLVGKYVGFLVLGDERLLLVNRIAPMIPFAGAFISIMKWDIKKSLAYILLGCVLKYGAIAILSGFFYSYFSSGTAQTVTIVMIAIVIAASVASSLVMSKRKGLR